MAEAVREMKRAAVEDDDARELLLRVAVLQQANRGYLRSRFTEVAEEGFDTAKYRYQSVLAGKPEAKEAHEIMKRLFNELEKRLPPNLSPPEGDARVAEILSEDFQRRASTRLIAMPTHWIAYGKIDLGAGQQ